ncbi:MAG: thiolase family protein [Deltaproteobacteria bacterium]|nr:thiolase family protein [Deltaproteobacteria bacterium]
MEKVAIIGVAQTKYQRNSPSSHDEMAFEVTEKALADAGLSIENIDNTITCTNDFWDGRTISCETITDATGSSKVPTTNVEGDGTYGVLMGLMRILSGHFETTLIVAQSKGSVGVPGLITNAIFDPLYERMLGLDAINSAALQARRYMTKYGVTEEQFAKVSVKNHKNAKNNPYAQLPLDLTVKDVLNSKILADPIKLLDTSPISDGACAVILARESVAKKGMKRPVWIKGVGHCTDSYHLSDRDLADVSALKAAAQKAYGMAGITQPRKEIGLAEVYDAFSYMELMWMEGLGICEQGEGGRMIDSGMTEMNGSLPVNPSGGVLSAHPVLAAGLARVAEVVLQLRGEGGARQVDRAGAGLAHGIEGACGQGHCVLIFEK